MSFVVVTRCKGTNDNYLQYIQGAAVKRPQYENCNIFETEQEF